MVFVVRRLPSLMRHETRGDRYYILDGVPRQKAAVHHRESKLNAFLDPYFDR